MKSDRLSKSPVQPGETLAGKYRVERVLGTGGMGTVVSARHLELGEPVAIKFLQPALADSETRVKRFLREGKAAARIRSEHVARVYDVGRLEDGAPYLVMEYLDGRDLQEWLATEGPLSPGLAVEYLLQACEAIASAHALGIIHRDLKPGNLFLAKRQDGSVAVKVIDFGISKLTAVVDSDDGADDGAITRSAIMMGSVLYMAPEQMRSARDVDARADIWSLGGALHAMLTGKPPFPGGSILDVCSAMIHGLKPLGEQCPDAPAELQAVLSRCLEYHPDSRYADVGELAAALEPLAPAHMHTYVERIARLVASAPPEWPSSVDEPSDPGASSHASAQTAPSHEQPVGAAQSGQGVSAAGRPMQPSGQAAELAPAGPSTADPVPRIETAEPATRELVASLPTRSRTAWIVGLVAIGVLGGAAIVLLSNNDEQPAPAATTLPTSTSAAATTLGATAAPPELAAIDAATGDAGQRDGAGGDASSAAEPATAAPSVDAPQTTAPPSPTPGRPPRRPPATRPPSGDIWADPH